MLRERPTPRNPSHPLEWVGPGRVPVHQEPFTKNKVDPFTLDFSTTDRRATSFVGVRHDVATNTSYRVRVERAGHAGP